MPRKINCSHASQIVGERQRIESYFLKFYESHKQEAGDYGDAQVCRVIAKQALWNLCCHVDLELTLIIGIPSR